MILFSLCCYFFRSKDLLAEAWGWGILVPYDHSVELPDYCSYLEHYYKENCNAITEVTGSNLVDVAETVSVELSPLLNHQFKLAPNFFLLVVFAILNWLSSSVSRRRMNLCLCGIVNRKNGWMVSYPEKLIF